MMGPYLQLDPGPTFEPQSHGGLDDDFPNFNWVIFWWLDSIVQFSRNVRKMHYYNGKLSKLP